MSESADLSVENCPKSRVAEQMLQQLKPRQRAVLEMTYCEGLTAEEIAQRLGQTSCSAPRTSSRAWTDESVEFHPTMVPGQPLYEHGPQNPGGKIINYNAFTYPAASQPGYGFEGDTPRNYARDFGACQMNFAIRREFPIHERMSLQFRAEAFNLCNHPAFSDVINNWGYGPYNPPTLFGFGAAGGTLNATLGGLNALCQTGGPRSLQIALKLVFWPVKPRQDKSGEVAQRVLRDSG